MLAKLKLALGVAVLSGFFVVAADNGALAAVPVGPSGITPQETQQFTDLINPATWNVDALVAWLETLRENHPEPGVVGEIAVGLALLVEDNNPNQAIIFALLQDMLAPAAGPAAGPQGFILPADTASLSENPCTSSPSPDCSN